MSTFPTLDRALTILGQWPNLVQAVDGLADQHGDEYRSIAEHHLSRLETATGADAFEEAVFGYMEMTIETLRLQSEFFRTGVFSVEESDFEAGLHADEDLMLGRYLPGLYLAQVFWPNAARARTSDVTLNDLSPHAKTFVERICADDQALSHEFMVQSFLDLDPAANTYDHIVFSEVVEHLPDPEGGMAIMADLLAPDGIVFFSTATNAAFYDHTIIFETVDEIMEMVERHGFEATEVHNVLATPGPDGRDVIDVNALLTKRSSS